MKLTTLRPVPLWQSGVIPESPFFQMRQFSRNLLLEATGLWSYPALVLRRDRLLWLHVVFPVARDDEKPGYWLYRPRAAAWTKPEDVVVARYQDFRWDEDPLPNLSWEEPLGRYPHPSVADLTAEALVRAELQLLCGYREAGLCFATTGQLPPGFRSGYLDVIHPKVLDNLYPLAPEFCKALRS